ncbi:alpha-protein kinase 2 isoform X2 [Acanthopagrus latus]|uniref:alpha-protein kinase 2 isoform X2 n=1 Tax=Acanthopagrus latus TaxID=8177 RepID=UPI00187CB87F|nr:alpha-protein kinase 2 isoform X2 [Acanthopagrus latus]
MDLSLLDTDDQTRSPAEGGDLDSPSVLHSLTDNTLSAAETGAETVSDPADLADESTETLSNVSKFLPREKSTDSDRLKSVSSSYNISECLSCWSESAPEDDERRVCSYFGSSEPVLPLLPQLSHDLITTRPELEFTVSDPGLSFSLIPQPCGAMSSASEGSMEPSVTEPFSDHSFSSDHSKVTSLLRSLSHQSDSLESDTAPMTDLYIFESETQGFILNPDVDPGEIKCHEYQTLSQTDPECDTFDLMRDSENAETQCQRGSSEARAMLNYESDVSQRTRLKPPAVNACETGLMSGNDASQETAEVTDVTPKPWRSDSPLELWLDACQYLAGEDTEDGVDLDKTRHPVMQGGLTATGGLSFPTRETQVSSYNPDSGEGIGWSDDDTRGWGPPVERWSSVDSWASALSDWTGILTSPPEDFTAAFTEIGAEIDALTQALAEVNTHIDTETSKEGGGQEAAARAQSQPTMGVQDQPLKMQNIPESPVLVGQSSLSLCLGAEGPELPGREGSQSTESLCDTTPTTQGETEPEEIQSSPTYPYSVRSSGATTASPGGYNEDVIPGSTSSVDLDLSHFGEYVGYCETDSFIGSEEDPILLNIIEDTDFETENPQTELNIYKPFADGLCEVTEEHRISQLGSVTRQEAKSSSGPAEVEGEVTECSKDFLDTHSHVPGVDTQPGLHINVPEHVSSDPSPDFDGACQLEPQWGSPKFIMPLAPLGISSTVFCQTSSGLKRDQTCVKRSLDVNRDLSCEQPSDLWPTSDGITGKPPLEGDEELIHKKENTTDSSEDSSSEGHRDLEPAGCLFTPRKTLIEDINDLSRELSNLAVVPADHFFISEENRIAVITLDLNDPFAARPAKPISVQSAKTQEKMPHKSHKSTSEGKKHLKKEKSAGHHHGAPASKKQESFSQNVSAQQVCKHEDTRPLTGENHTNENTPARLEDKETKLVIETGVATEKAPCKSHGKKKKKHAQNATGVKTVGEPLVEVENGAKPKTARGRIDTFEEKLGAKAGKAQKDGDQSHGAEKKAQQPDAKAPLEEQPPHHPDHKDHQVKHVPSPLKDDVKRPRLSGDKFGKILSAMESKLPKADVSIKAKGEERKADAGATPKKAYSEVVKQKVPPKEEPKVVKPIQAEAVSGDPQSLCLWCQFSAVFSHHTVTWSRDGTVLAETKRRGREQSVAEYLQRLSQRLGQVPVSAHQLTRIGHPGLPAHVRSAE